MLETSGALDTWKTNTPGTLGSPGNLGKLGQPVHIGNLGNFFWTLEHLGNLTHLEHPGDPGNLGSLGRPGQPWEPGAFAMIFQYVPKTFPQFIQDVSSDSVAQGFLHTLINNVLKAN